MKSKIVRLGVVGLRRGGYVTKEIIGDKNVVVRAIADKNSDRLTSCKKEYEEAGVRDLLCFDCYEDLLKSDIDAVFIATDKPYHTKHTLMALEAGKHVLSEIPVIETEEEAKLLYDAVKAHPELKYMAGENCFYWAFIEAWKKMREDGKFGEVLYAEAEYIHPLHPDAKDETPDGHWRLSNHAITYLTHSLGPLLHILDDECVSVSCMTPTAAKYDGRKIGDENGIAIFKTKKGAVIRIFIGFGLYHGADHNYAIYGTRGSIMTDKTTPLDEAHSFANLYEVPGTFERAFKIPVTCSLGKEGGAHGGADTRMLRDFIRCIIEDTPPPINVDMGIRFSLPGIIAEKSAHQGGKLMKIPSFDKDR